VKAGVPLATVGQVELVFFVANFFLYFWQNGTNTAMLSWASGEDRTKVAGAIFSGMHVHALLAVVGMLFIAQFPIETKAHSIVTGYGLVAMLAYVFFSIPAGAIVYAYLIRQQYKHILWYTTITQLLQVGLVAGMIISGYSLPEMLLAVAILSFAKWLFVFTTGGWLKQPLSRVTMWGFVAFSMPMIIHSFNSGLTDYVDGWIVSFFYGDDTFALYRYGARELPFNAMLIGGLIGGLINRFMMEDRADPAFMKKETLRIMRLLFPINILLIFLSVPLYSLIYKEEFELSARIFNIYALTLLSRVILSQVFCYVRHHRWLLTWSTAGEVVLNVLLSLLLMQWLGLWGIPLATVLAYLAQKLFLIIYVRRAFDVHVSEYLPVPQTIWYFAAMIGSVIAAELIYF
jgi:O-antigen/teichoic acid export membrane protein